jgi:hypothetical protein
MDLPLLQDIDRQLGEPAIRGIAGENRRLRCERRSSALRLRTSWNGFHTLTGRYVDLAGLPTRSG